MKSKTDYYSAFLANLIKKTDSLNGLSELDTIIIKEDIMNEEILQTLVQKITKLNLTNSKILNQQEKNCEDQCIKKEMTKIIDNADNLEIENENKNNKNIQEYAKNQSYEELIFQLSIQEIIEIILLIGTSKISNILKTKKTLKHGICGKMINEYELYYHCNNCDKSNSSNSFSIFCKDCFQIDKHINHDYFFVISFSSGGICDCGDSEWIDPEGFCTFHFSQISSSNLIQSNLYITNIVNSLIKIMFYEYNKEFIKISNEKFENGQLTKFFCKIKILIDCDDLKFLFPILNGLTIKPNNAYTNHCCDPNMQSEENHICTCSVFDNLIRAIPHINKENRKDNLVLVDLCKKSNFFSFEFIKSFFKIYKEMITNLNLRLNDNDCITSLLNQTNWNNPHIIEYFLINYKTYWIPSLEEIKKIILSSPKSKENFVFISVFYLDSTMLLKPNKTVTDAIICDPNFLALFFSIFNELSFHKTETIISKLDLKQEFLIDDFNYIELSNITELSRLFILMVQEYVSKNNNSNHIILKYMLKSILNLINLKEINIKKCKPIDLSIFRVFGSFLIKLILNISEPINSDNFIMKIKHLIINESGISDNELIRIAKFICSLILYQFQNICKLKLLLLSGQFKYEIENFNFNYFNNTQFLIYQTDILLIQLFLLFLDNDSIAELFNLYLKADDDVREIIKDDKQKVNKYYEEILYLFMCIMKDDISAITILYHCYVGNYREDISDDLKSIHNYLSKKLSAIIVLRNEKHYEGFSEETIKKMIPEFLKDKFHEINVKQNYKTSIVGTKLCMIFDDDSIQFLNLFNNNLLNDFLNSFMNLSRMVEKKLITEVNLYDNKSSYPNEFFNYFYQAIRNKFTCLPLCHILAQFIDENQSIPVNSSELVNEWIIGYFYLSIKNNIAIKDDKIIFKVINLLLNTPIQNNLIQIILNDLKFLFHDFQSNNSKSIVISKNIKNIKSEQEKIKQRVLFQMKQKCEKFKNNNIQYFDKNCQTTLTDNENVCVVCKEGFRITFNEEDMYGELCSFSVSDFTKKIFYNSLKDFTSLNFEFNFHFFEEKLCLFESLSLKSFYVHSCGHLIHEHCFLQIMQLHEISVCPLCGYYIEFILPIFQKENKFEQIPIFIQEIMMKILKFPQADQLIIKNNLLISNLLMIFVLICNSMINCEEMLTPNHSSLKIINILKLFLSAITYTNIADQQSLEIKQIYLPLLTEYNDSWNSSILLNQLILLLYEYLKIKKSSNSFDNSLFNTKINSILIAALVDLIQRILLLNYCKVLKTNLIDFDKFSKFIFNKTMINDEIIHELTRFLKKFIIVKLIFLNQTFFLPSELISYNESILNTYNLDDKILLMQQLKCFSLGPLSFEKIIENSLNNLQRIQNNPVLLFLKLNSKFHGQSMISNISNENNKLFKIEVPFFLYSRNFCFQIENLPLSYDLTIMKYFHQNCEKCTKYCRNKSICLICGTILCVNSEDCHSNSNINEDETITHSNSYHMGESYYLRFYFSQVIGISFTHKNLISKFYLNESGEDLYDGISFRSEINGKHIKDYKLNTNLLDNLKKTILRCGITREILKSLIKERSTIIN